MVLTEYPWHGYELARQAIDGGRDTLIACGGDGTVYEVANAILDLGVAATVRLGTVPLGTGKDVAKCLGIGRPAAALRAIAAGHERAVDAGRVECVDATGQPMVRHVLLEVSAGWIPEISHSVPPWLKRMGDTSPYIAMTFAKMLGPMNRYFSLEIDGLDYHAPYNSISAHNMAFWGGDLEAAPGADPADGLLDVIRWGPLGRRAVLTAVQGQRRGGEHLRMEGVDHHAAKRLTLDSPRRTQLDFDGESGGFLPASIEVVPHALRFLRSHKQGVAL
jgi:diacylglycerol kinase family enzyme